ncbi:hypothetical protein ALUC_30787A [Aspergillus luchuensis]|nr:hypothetical protein ALUC_30787A [Aspergillus luchuensis]
MDVLYQIWSRFLVQNFNAQMYNEFKSLAFDDFFARNVSGGFFSLHTFCGNFRRATGVWESLSVFKEPSESDPLDTQATLRLSQTLFAMVKSLSELKGIKRPYLG